MPESTIMMDRESGVDAKLEFPASNYVSKMLPDLEGTRDAL